MTTIYYTIDNLFRWECGTYSAEALARRLAAIVADGGHITEVLQNKEM